MIIAIDAASTDLSVAIANADGSSIDEVAWTSEQRQSAELLPRLLELLETNGRSLHDAAAVATGTGPGSFTGLRVGLAVVRGLAVGLGIPAYGIGSLEILAAGLGPIALPIRAVLGGRVIAVDRNPAQDISALRTINFVMKGGQVIRNDQ